MMLFKLSLKNIKKSFKDYSIYFFTLILGVAVFYIFNSIESQTVMLNISSNTRDIIKLMNNILAGVSVFVSFILGFLIIYASRFLMKRRNKEFGIYMTLGMGKKQISKILLFETILIGILSLGVGLLIGIFGSQLMSIFVAKMFEADMTKFEFVFSTEACIKTCIYFGIMYVFVMIFHTISISKCKLIDLIHSSKKTEQIKMKNTYISVFVFIISCIVLSIAYYMVTEGVTKYLDTANKIFIPIGLGCIGTFLLFWSLSGFILKIVMSMKGIYYKGLNSFTLRQISSKINTMVVSMTIICLMLFVTICTLSTAISLKESLTKDIETLTPVDIQLGKKTNLSDSEIEKNEYTQEQVNYSKVSIENRLRNLNFDTNTYFKDIVTYKSYRIDGLTLGKTLGNKLEEIQQEFPYLITTNEEKVIGLSDYNKIAKLYGQEQYELQDNEYIIIADYDSSVQLRNVALKDNTEITINEKQFRPKYTECKNGFVQISGNRSNDGIIILPDSAVDERYVVSEGFIANYNTKDKAEKEEIEKKITGLIENDFNSYKSIAITTNTRIDIFEASIGLGAMATFIGVYLGIIFLISGAAILALKELSESSDNKERFGILRKLGADEKMINLALFKQIAIFFLFPLIIACIHSIFGIKFCNTILEGIGTSGLMQSIITTAIFLVIIYGGYFIITYFSSKRIIKEDE